MDVKQPRHFITNIKFCCIAGVGFFIDGYINFIIGLVVPVLGYLYYGSEDNVPTVLGDVVKGCSSLGMIAGQLCFGMLGDAVGRRKVYGKELMFTLFGSLMVIVVPRSLSPHSIFSWIAVFRVVTGFGIGGDYPVSSTLSTEKENKGYRSDLSMLVFAFLGVGTAVGGIVFLILLAAFKDLIEKDVFYLEYVWRVLIALGMIPGIITLYYRITMAETLPYKKYVQEEGFKEHVKMFLEYFSDWRHLRVLLATSFVWFLFDIAFYGVSFNQAPVLESIGFGGGDTTYEVLYNLAVGNVIVSALGGLVGYYIAIPFLRIFGRVQLQIWSCAVVSLIYAIWAGVYFTSNSAGKIVLFTLSQLFLNAGPSATTYLIPTDIFPTRCRASAHGISAAAGKAGAVLTTFVFGTATEKMGFRGLLGFFSGIMLVCVIVSFIIPESKNATIEDIESDYMFKHFTVKEHFKWYGWKTGEHGVQNCTVDATQLSPDSKDNKSIEV